MDTIMPQWRIDTLDARGGLAFASWREDDSAGDRDVGRELPCIFIGAPDFIPQPVANYAIALAASRGAFQDRLFVDQGKAEASFPTQGAVAEFVRRAYVRGGGGDGTDGGGETPLPRPSNRPDLPLFPEFFEERQEGRKLRSAIYNAIELFQKVTGDFYVGEAKSFNEWPPALNQSDQKSGNVLADGVGMLASAALRLINEMILRLPPAKEPHALARWQRDARGLGSLIARLELWPVLFAAPNYESLTRLAEYLLHQKSRVVALDFFNRMSPSDERSEAIVYLLFVDGPDIDDYEGVEGFVHYLHYWQPNRRIPSFWAMGSRTITDPILDLIRIPLPEHVEKILDLDLQGEASLYHALTAFIGSPDMPGGAAGKELIDLVLFASACIAGPGRNLPLSLGIGSGWAGRDGRRNISSIRQAALQETAGTAWNWLREQLPGFVFPIELEKAIEATAKLRYPTANSVRTVNGRA